jgi:hypothetical protein
MDNKQDQETGISISYEKTIFERAIIEAIKQETSKVKFID